MMRETPKSAPFRAPGITQVEFDSTKYGPEILIDVAWASDMPTFVHPEPHALSFYDIFLVTAGSGSFWLDSHRYPVVPGTVFFTTPGQVRQWNVRRLEGLCLFFPAVFLEVFFRDEQFLHRLPYFHVDVGAGALRLESADRRWLQGRLRNMRAELPPRMPDGIHLLRARLYEVLILLARLYARAKGVPPKRIPNDVTARYRQLVAERAARSHRVADYARELGVSPGYLNRLCLAHLGAGAKMVIAEHLATAARRRLLYSGDSIARIASGLGFSDASYFSRFIRRATGRSPTAIRRELARVGVQMKARVR